MWGFQAGSSRPSGLTTDGMGNAALDAEPQQALLTTSQTFPDRGRYVSSVEGMLNRGDEGGLVAGSGVGWVAHLDCGQAYWRAVEKRVRGQIQPACPWWVREWIKRFGIDAGCGRKSTGVITEALGCAIAGGHGGEADTKVDRMEPSVGG